MVAGFRHALDHEVVEFRDVRVDATAHAHTAGPHRRAVDARKRLLQRGIVRAEHSAVDEVRLPFHAPGSPGGGPAAKRALPRNRCCSGGSSLTTRKGLEKNRLNRVAHLPRRPLARFSSPRGRWRGTLPSRAPHGCERRATGAGPSAPRIIGVSATRLLTGW